MLCPDHWRGAYSAPKSLAGVCENEGRELRKCRITGRGYGRNPERDTSHPLPTYEILAKHCMQYNCNCQYRRVPTFLTNRAPPSLNLTTFVLLNGRNVSSPPPPPPSTPSRMDEFCGSLIRRDSRMSLIYLHALSRAIYRFSRSSRYVFAEIIFTPETSGGSIKPMSNWYNISVENP